MRVRFWRRRRRPAASHRQAAGLPSGLTFRRRRPRTKQGGASADRGLARLSFRRFAAKPAGARSGGVRRRLSFTRAGSKSTAAGGKRTASRLTFRRGANKPLPAPLDRLPRGLTFRRARAAGPDNAGARTLTRLRLRRKPTQPPGPPKKRSAPDAVGLTLRLTALGFAACMLQLLIVSQISVLGVSADVAPLVVAAAGFLCGSLPGAVFGFAIGLFIDLAFVQVLGISSLLFTLIGYGAGRLRELRAPAAPLTRLGLGAVATALALTGYGTIEFMLGVNTPVSYGLAGAIVKTTLLNSLIAIPVYALTRRSLLAALPTSERLLDRQPPPDSGRSPLSRT
jgi:cell shape-determining protein MreD